MKNKLLFGIGCLVGLIAIVSCGRSFSDYQHTADGLYYRFIEMDSSRPMPQEGDFLMLSMDQYSHDTLAYSSTRKGEYPRIQMKASEQKGDILSGLAMMHEGDSASFIVTAEDDMRYEVRLVQIQSKEDLEAEVETLYKKLKSKSDQAFNSYLEENQIYIRPTPHGVYYWTTKSGTGKKPVAGDLVEVHYEGRFLNGEVFDSNYKTDSTFSFILGSGFVIPGWDEVVPLMRVGESATMIIPYQMAYNDRVVGVIPPYSNLIYDIEILNITDSKVVDEAYQKRMEDLKVRSGIEFKEYLERHHVSVAPTASGLYIIPQKKGNGAPAQAGMLARIKFEARTLGDDLLGYAESPYQDVMLGRGMLMPGVEEGLMSMSEGDSVTLIIPYHLAYGQQGYGAIAPYTNVVLGLSLLQLLPSEE